MIPSSLFRLTQLQPDDERAAPSVGQNIRGSFLLNLPDFNIENTDGSPAETIREELSVISKAKVPLLSNNLSRSGWGCARKSPSDAFSVSTASTTSLRDEESDIETEQEDGVPITSLPPDALFIVQGKEFPCHTKLLSQEAPPLIDILSRDGVLERKTKRQRTSSPSRDESEGDHEPQLWSSPSGITVARLSDGVSSDFFEVLMEFVYTKEIRLKLPEGFQEDDQEDDPWLMGNDDKFEEEEGDDYTPDILPLEDERTESTTPLKFLQESFSLANRFGCASLKSAIEYKIYDEFLFSFAATELIAWAEQHDCVFLKQKALEKLQ